MMDRRESILARLLVVAEGVQGIARAHRNTMGLSDDARPAIIILDADEAGEGVNSTRGKGPQMMVLNPEIYILASGKSDSVGSVINELRVTFLKAVLEDAELQTLTGQNGSVTYEGCATGLSRGRSMEGEMGVSIAFTYPFLPSEL